LPIERAQSSSPSLFPAVRDDLYILTKCFFFRCARKSFFQVLKVREVPDWKYPWSASILIVLAWLSAHKLKKSKPLFIHVLLHTYMHTYLVYFLWKFEKFVRAYALSIRIFVSLCKTLARHGKEVGEHRGQILSLRWWCRAAPSPSVDVCRSIVRSYRALLSDNRYSYRQLSNAYRYYYHYYYYFHYYLLLLILLYYNH
jgi:hypothetical protein